MNTTRSCRQSGRGLSVTIELLATVVVPFLAAAFSLMGSIFSEVSQRGRIKSDIDIYQSLSSIADGVTTGPVPRNMLSEHIERELSMLTGGKARWTCLPRAILFLVLGGVLFFALVRLALLLDATDPLSPLYVYVYFLLLVLGAWCLMAGLRNLYRYVALRSHLLQVLSRAQTTSKSIEKLCQHLADVVNNETRLSKYIEEVTINLEDYRPNIESVPPKVIITNLNEVINNLKSFREVFLDNISETDDVLYTKSCLTETISDILRDASYIEDRSLFSISLKGVRQNLTEQQSKLERLDAEIREASSRVSRCKRIVDKSIELYNRINDSGIFNNQIVIEDSDMRLRFITDNEMYEREHLDSFFADLMKGKYRLFRTEKGCSTLVVGKENGELAPNGRPTFTVIGFLSSADGSFPGRLIISEGPLHHLSR